MLKSQKGVTLLSVIIYVLVMAMVVGIVATISVFFYQNIIHVKDGGQNAAEYNKFNMYFLEETKQKNNFVEEIDKNTGTYIRFTNGNEYKFQDNGIYRNEVKICTHIKEAGFKVQYRYDLTIISVYMQIGENSEFSKTTEYTLQGGI